MGASGPWDGVASATECEDRGIRNFTGAFFHFGHVLLQ